MEKEYLDASNDELFDFLFVKIVKFPYRSLFIIIVTALLIAPTYPTTMSSYHWSCWVGRGPVVEDFDLQPPLIVLLNGFDWDDSSFFFGSIDSGIATHHTASPYPMLVYLAIIILLGIWLWRKNVKNQFISTRMDDTIYSLKFFGFALLAIGIFLSLGLFMNTALGGTMRLPLDGWSQLMIIFVLVVPFIIALSLYLLKQTNELVISPKNESNLTTFESMFPVTFSTGIIAFVIICFVTQASIPHQEPPSIHESIQIMTIGNITTLTSTSVNITFNLTYPGNNADGIVFYLYLGGDSNTIEISWPDTITDSPLFMTCNSDAVRARFYPVTLESTPTVNSGDYLIIHGLEPGVTYSFRAMNTYSCSMISITGLTTFTMPEVELNDK